MRLRLGRGRLVRRGQRKNQAAALGSAALLQPLALVGWLMAFWRLGGDLQWTRPFAITRGVFSHWQVWIALAAGLQVGAASLAAKINSHDKISEEN